MIARQIYDKDGEVIRLTKDGRRIKDGKISKEVFDIEMHQEKKKKKKKEKQMLEKSYEEEYVEEFIDEEGRVVKVVKKRLKEKSTIPGKRPATPLTGVRRVQVLFLKGGVQIQNRLQQLLRDCPLNDVDPRFPALVEEFGAGAMDLDEREGAIDYLTHYRLVNPDNLEGYAKAFLVEDVDENSVINMDETRVALEGIPGLQGMNDKQVNYILKVLGIDDATEVTFKMFAVIC
uniref:EF-hand domain-containing protein n=1 Tax=Ciona savignyi TaxID=51511 RepID=H2Y9S5_CIOSA